ncbi:hypothetical protein P8920_21150 [Bacillus atrophaeus]|uniref:hypothetical protein n=1 Tax=Bacillus atrophaeus TaxID=1452 RepID=UPI002DBA2C07|nr:hypothetical protein [Bacillus atrophaeus]MEC0835163.1 hypothetical protein [Bacillus atrophaeus]
MKRVKSLGLKQSLNFSPKAEIFCFKDVYCCDNNSSCEGSFLALQVTLRYKTHQAIIKALIQRAFIIA